MAFNQELAVRIQKVLMGTPGLDEKKMFGGVGYLIHGNMACGVNKDDLIIRVGPEAYEQELSTENVKEFDMTGRPMKGWIVVREEGYKTEMELKNWVEKGVAFASSLPAK